MFLEMKRHVICQIGAELIERSGVDGNMLNVMALRLHVDLFHPFLGTEGGLDDGEHASDVRYVLDNRNDLLDLGAVLVEEFVDLLHQVKPVVIRHDALEVLEFYGLVLDFVEVFSSDVVLLHLGGKGIEVQLQLLLVGGSELEGVELLAELLLVILDRALHLLFEFVELVEEKFLQCDGLFLVVEFQLFQLLFSLVFLFDFADVEHLFQGLGIQRDVCLFLGFLYDLRHFCSFFDVGHADGAFEVNILCCFIQLVFSHSLSLCQILDGQQKHASILQQLASFDVVLPRWLKKDEFAAIRKRLIVLPFNHIGIAPRLNEGRIEWIDFYLSAVILNLACFLHYQITLKSDVGYHY